MWDHPEIVNPEYNPEDAAGITKDAENCKTGFDLWQVKPGIIFDNLLTTIDPKAAADQGLSILYLLW